MRRLSVCSVLLCLASALSSGDPQEAAPKPVFPAEAELVRLDLLVRDKGGRPVDDLRADEVRVFEDGKACAVRSFRLVQAGEPRPPRRGDTGRAAGAVEKAALRMDRPRPVALSASSGRRAGRRTRGARPTRGGAPS